MKRAVIPIHKRAVALLGTRKPSASEIVEGGLGTILAEAIRNETIPAERIRFDKESRMFFVTVDIDFEGPLS